MRQSEWQDAVITRGRDTRRCVHDPFSDAPPACRRNQLMTASTTRRTTAARSRIAAVGAIAVAGALILTGCGDQTEKGSSATPSGGTSKDSSAPLFSALPKKIQDAGVIKIGTDSAYAP